MDNHYVEVQGRKVKTVDPSAFYPQLEEHLTQDEPFPVSVVDLHDSLSHSEGASDVQAGTAACRDLEHFTNFLIHGREEEDDDLPEFFNMFWLVLHAASKEA
ncbi:hypothetical protein Nepgr_010036 [Nepenthes gracilis]|uniref:Uncharacterized protein n=1 Tax=Nepenthes gracilis TaxID=150966 RepID=A0AAD3SCC2_NEPGR|nr:hypothetical protein Nepgr_010036 [Nepenthes gracilis]